MLLNQIAGDKDLLFEYEGFFEEFQKRLALHQWLPKEILAGLSENKELSRAMDWVLRQKNASDSQDYGDIIAEAFWAGRENTDNLKFMLMHIDILAIICATAPETFSSPLSPRIYLVLKIF